MPENLFILEKDLARQIIDTLNSIPVSGRENLDKMLGVILVMEQAMNPPKDTGKEEEENG